MTPLLVATRNTHKTAEIAAMLAGFFEVSDLRSLPGAPEVEETGTTFAENAALKATAISRFNSGWALADDSGLEVDALGGAPGVYSARFAGETATDADNNNLLFARLAELPHAPRTARFRCVLALAQNGALLETFDGAVEGRVIETLRGPGGFGYDPLFIPDGFEQTFGELPADGKTSISHRSRALVNCRAWLESHP
ncbi:MAG: RdgB/HAM1 family non-canonical purine NTP pyrophosphatase, partial [Chthoniobacterales bacterium]